MLKTLILASAAAISMPALAQDMPQQEMPTTQAQPAEPMTESPAEPQAMTPDAADTATAQTSTPQPATAEQIAQVVDTGFPTYDKDADGDLKPEEFGEWMVALRSATEPAFTGQSAADKQWIGQALAAADTDKSGTVNKDELKTFLAPQAS